MRLSIVTIHLNNFLGLQRTLDSVHIAREQEPFEWIVIDGDSTIEDIHKGLMDQVKSSADHLIIEPDNGIYDAMNKGSRLAKGDYVLYLNSGDELHPDFNLSKAWNLTEEHTADMMWGSCEVCYQDGSQFNVKTRSTAWAWYCMPAYHPAILFRRTTLGKHPYDTRYRFAADYDLVCRLLKNEATVHSMDMPISIYHRGGISDIEGDAARNEENDIRLKYFHLPDFIGNSIKKFKKINGRQSSFSKVVRQLRKKI